MKLWKTAITLTIGGLSTLLLNGWKSSLNAETLLATPSLAVVPSEDQLKSTDADQIYAQAKNSLSEEYYVLYRIAERISRANQLDNLAWRIYVDPEYNINAFAADVNLVAVNAGLLDRVDNNVNAIACVVGHEMAHHTETHIAISQAEQEATLVRLREEAFEEVAAEEEDLRQDLEQLNIGTWVAGGAGTLVDMFADTGGWGTLLGGLLGGVLQGQQQRRLQAAAERIDAIYLEKEAIQQQEWSELSHAHEFEADEVGYYYMARAGFNPEGCLTSMEMLKRLGVADSPSHPATPDRIAELETLMAEVPATTLVNQGQQNLVASSTPLLFEMSRDGFSLLINSRAGSGGIDDQFPD